MRNISELHISIGLPGSGKTTEFKKLSSQDGRGSMYVDCDAFLREKQYKDIDRLLKDRSSVFEGKVFLDGFFLTKDDVKKIVDIVRENKRLKINKVIIHYWVPNRDICKWNDRGRRSVNSRISIENATIDEIKDIMLVSADYEDIKFEKKLHAIVKKEGWKVFAGEHGLSVDESGILKGASWSLGGTWGSYSGSGGTVSPSAAPDGFRELDDFLEKVAPEITFLQYKKIMSECVSIREYSEGDYYGGRVTYNEQLLDVKALYNYLVDREIIVFYE